MDKRLNQILRRVSCLTYLACLSALLSSLSHSLSANYLDESIRNQVAIALGQPYHAAGLHFVVEPFYNRILFPYLLVSAKHFFEQVTWFQIFALVRFIEFFVCLYIVYFSLERRHDTISSDPPTLMALFSLAFIPSLIFPWELPSDIIDFTLSYLAFLAILEGRLTQAILIAILTSINRESGAFAEILYGSLYFWRVPWPALLTRFLLLSCIPYGAAVAIRAHQLGLAWGETGQQYTGIWFNAKKVLDWLRDPLQFEWFVDPVLHLWPILGFSMVFMPLYILQVPAREDHVRVMAALALILLVTALFGNWSEPRVFIPATALICAAAVARPNAGRAGDNGGVTQPPSQHLALGKHRTMSA
jgi:hypothetical protein